MKLQRIHNQLCWLRLTNQSIHVIDHVAQHFASGLVGGCEDLQAALLLQ